MSHSRFTAIDITQNRASNNLNGQKSVAPKISTFFGENVFNDEKMREYLSDKAYKIVKSAISSGEKLTREVAEFVAEGMKKWALDKGVTHYTHWFQPLTGRTAEKHDSFFTLKPDGSITEEFSVDTLVQQEPDGSSFPGGGLRSTFEARGYTAWDPTSPAFVLEVGSGKTLCIPTIFVTYSGESLDYKLPLLKSQAHLERAAIPVCQLFDENVEKVFVTLGWEQEYFVVDEALYNARPDLVMTGRTLLGKRSPKGQHLDDHYFGTIPERVYAFMRDLETECYKLAIPITTRHNEVGPGQYEFAPIFEEVNVAVDHNQLLMDLMDRVAYRHKLRVLLHEKPFEGVNGSGKHNNWSMATNTGKNLLSPGKVPGKNLQFLTFFVNTIRAVAEHADLLRASVATAGNDHRLGANEAPPAIVSIFVGHAMTKLLKDIKTGGEINTKKVQHVLDLLAQVPDLEMDNTDRNRTSPFAFTGNKFEIRMVGSAQNCAGPMTVMNTIVGKQLLDFKAELDGLMAKGAKRGEGILTIMRRYLKESESILFEGDGYSDDWKEEAAKRGLSNTPGTPDAIGAYLSESSKAVFTECGVFSERELEAHYEVMCENYIIKLQIESRTIGEMVLNHIVPAAAGYLNTIAENVQRMKDLGLGKDSYAAQMEIVESLSININKIKKGVDELFEARRTGYLTTDITDQAKYYYTTILPQMTALRTYSDELEFLVEDRQWPLVKYRELMFLK